MGTTGSDLAALKLSSNIGNPLLTDVICASPRNLVEVSKMRKLEEARR